MSKKITFKKLYLKAIQEYQLDPVTAKVLLDKILLALERNKNFYNDE